MSRLSALAVTLGLATLALASGPGAKYVCRDPTAPAPAATPAPGSSSAGLTLRAADGVVVHARHLRVERPSAVILLFHQAGAGAGEYAAIAPRLAAAGYETLAVDQRSGGDMFGRNETLAALGLSTGYGEARRDLEAALAWGRSRHLPVVLWGSSYSAALVFQVAAASPDGLAAVVAYSPGEYLDLPGAVRSAARGVRAPVFVDTATEAGEVAAASVILAASPSASKVQHRPRSGIHGSSTLDPARNPAGSAASWGAVLRFLGEAVPRRRGS